MLAEVGVDLDGSVLARLGLGQSDGIVVKELPPGKQSEVRDA